MVTDRVIDQNYYNYERMNNMNEVDELKLFTL